MTKPQDTRPRRDAGLTATELIVTSGVLVILTGIIWTTFRYDIQSYSRQTNQNMTQGTLRIFAARMQQDFRRACFNPTDNNPNAFVIVSASPTDFHFNLDEGTTTGTLSSTDPHSNLGYRLNGTNLEGWATGSTWRVVLQNVTSITYAYYDVQGQQVNQTSPYTSTEEIAEVDVTLSAQSTTGGFAGAPAPVITEHFKASLRNLC